MEQHKRADELCSSAHEPEIVRLGDLSEKIKKLTDELNTPRDPSNDVLDMYGRQLPQIWRALNMRWIKRRSFPRLT